MAKDPKEFARSDLDQIIAKHDPEASREQGKHPRAVALGLKGGVGANSRVKPISVETQIRLPRKQQKQAGPSNIKKS